MKNEKEIKARIEKQIALCKEFGLPMFVNISGACWSCGRQVFEIENGEDHVTGCPFCHRSFCD